MIWNRIHGVRRANAEISIVAQTLLVVNVFSQMPEQKERVLLLVACDCYRMTLVTGKYRVIYIC